MTHLSFFFPTISNNQIAIHSNESEPFVSLIEAVSVELEIFVYCFGIVHTSYVYMCSQFVLQCIWMQNQSSEEDSHELMLGIEWNLWQCCYCRWQWCFYLFIFFFVLFFIYGREFSAKLLRTRKWDGKIVESPTEKWNQQYDLQCIIIIIEIKN